ncbi:MAG TPA: hypothetical protein VEO54_31535 [Thermoanaerobaculia bacterium]|nr:hypothetical protein [Thermoanaerobaculia bacterium]
MRISLLGYAAGAICLALGLSLITMAAVSAAGGAIYSRYIPRSLAVTQLVTGLLFVAVTARLWWGSIQRAAGDHLLADQRGLLVGLMVVTTAIFLALIAGAMFLPAFWAGAFDGMLDAARGR